MLPAFFTATTFHFPSAIFAENEMIIAFIIGAIDKPRRRFAAMMAN
jgi:hypothetical protein